MPRYETGPGGQLLLILDDPSRRYPANHGRDERTWQEILETAVRVTPPARRWEA